MAYSVLIVQCSLYCLVSLPMNTYHIYITLECTDSGQKSDVITINTFNIETQKDDALDSIMAKDDPYIALL